MEDGGETMRMNVMCMGSLLSHPSPLKGRGLS